MLCDAGDCDEAAVDGSRYCEHHEGVVLRGEMEDRGGEWQ